MYVCASFTLLHSSKIREKGFVAWSIVSDRVANLLKQVLDVTRKNFKNAMEGSCNATCA